MPLSTNVKAQFVTVTRGCKYVISSDSGNLDVVSVTIEGSGPGVENDEGTVADGERMFYQGRADKLKVTPSTVGVFWSVNKVVS